MLSSTVLVRQFTGSQEEVKLRRNPREANLYEEGLSASVCDGWLAAVMVDGEIMLCQHQLTCTRFSTTKHVLVFLVTKCGQPECC